MKKLLISVLVIFLLPIPTFASSIAWYVASTRNEDDGMTFCQEYDDGSVFMIWNRREANAFPGLPEEFLKRRAMVQYEGASSARQAAYNMEVPTCGRKYFLRFKGKTRNIMDAEEQVPLPILMQ